MSDYWIPSDEPDGPPYPPMSPERREHGTFAEDNDPKFQRVGICHTCKHRTSAFRCRAFPDGIPVEVQVGRLLHVVPLPGDHGIQFEGVAI